MSIRLFPWTQHLDKQAGRKGWDFNMKLRACEKDGSKEKCPPIKGSTNPEILMSDQRAKTARDKLISTGVRGKA